MAINIIDPEVPRVLPHARLYLDDIEQILHIFSDVERKVANAVQGTSQPPQPTLRIGNKETHEIEDLPKITKRTSDLTLRLEWHRLTLLFRVDRSGPQWWSAGLSRADAWETHHKLEEIIRPRVVLLGGLARTRPGALYTITGAASTLGAFLALLGAYVLAHKFVPHLTSWYAALIIGLLQGAAAVLGFKITNLILEPRSTVTLRYSYDQAARREERNSKLLFAVLGWAFGTITTLLGIYAKHKFWP